jgi:hypothetical protein
MAVWEATNYAAANRIVLELEMTSDLFAIRDAIIETGHRLGAPP